MNKNKRKIILAGICVFMMTLIFSIPCFADFVIAEHMDPVEEIREYDAFPYSECNRVINVTMVDTGGNLLGKVVVNTKYGVEDRLVVNLGGYNITKFESNQGIWETCKLTWTSGTTAGEAESSCFIKYYFRTRLSRKELNVTVTYRRWAPIEFEVRHYVEKEKLNYFSKDNYELHSITDKKKLDYYEHFNVKSKYIYGYTLNEGYESNISEPLCLMGLKGKYKNTPSSPRFYSYTSHPTRWAEGMQTFSKYDEAKDGKISYYDDFKVVIEFLYDLKEYTIKFNANGGYGAPGSVVKCHRKNISLPTKIPSRPGYVFQGWGTAKTDKNPNYQPGAMYTANMSTTLYAIWEKAEIPSYKVSYNDNGGFDGPADQKKILDRPLELSSSKPTRPGYKFIGWGTYASDKTVNYNPGDTYFINEPLNLYAIWEKHVFKYAIQFNPNKGINPPEPIIKTKDVPIYLPQKMPSRTGYTFLGWSENKNATYPTYYAGEKFTSNKNSILYAVWDKKITPKYTITFDAKGGKNPPAKIIKSKDVNVYIPFEGPVKDQYKFLGWSESNQAKSPTYKVGDVFTKNEDTTLYAVWRFNPSVYYVVFNANGGEHAPANMRKTHGLHETIPSQIPTRNLYNFLGWSESNTASEPTYLPGDNYAREGNVTLYAVWEKAGYDFSISGLTISKTDPYRYEKVKISCTVYNNDRKNGYNHIPIDFYYDGNKLETRYIDFSKNSFANIAFELNVGGYAGKKDVEIRVNWENRNDEKWSYDNSCNSSITVRDYFYEVSVDPVTPGSSYKEGTTVISSFLLKNDGDTDILPKHNNTVKFEVYYFSGSYKKVIFTDVWNQAVVPGHGTNLVYFKWNVPQGIYGKTVYMKCTVNSDNAFIEHNTGNNTVTYENIVEPLINSQTPNTRYEEHKPPEYHYSKPPVEKKPESTWTMWVYENGKLELKKYGISLSGETPSIRPSLNSTSAKYESGKWVMKSGYGITIDYSINITNAQGFMLPESGSFSFVQSVNAYFPEFSYSTVEGHFRTLKNTNNKFEFISNPDAKQKAKEHFLPIYVDDGDYTVSLKLSEIWTPTGMIEGIVNSNTILISGTMYDDFYVGGND